MFIIILDLQENILWFEARYIIIEMTNMRIKGMHSFGKYLLGTYEYMLGWAGTKDIKVSNNRCSLVKFVVRWTIECERWETTLAQRNYPDSFSAEDNWLERR